MIYCFDIDGTICTLREDSDYYNAEPYVEIINKINNLYDEGHVIKMMTARGSVSGKDWTSETQQQLQSWGLRYHELIMNKKPHADIFIDDKAMHINDWHKNKVTGFIAGCFDIIHPGYINMFKDAKNVCNHLIVALHEDPSIEREHKYKPLHTVEERESILLSIKYVDEVLHYKTESDLEKLLIDTMPDYRIMGSDYLEKEFTGKNIKGIEIYYHERDHDWSYSNLRRKM